jgi:hypothetical protein
MFERVFSEFADPVACALEWARSSERSSLTVSPAFQVASALHLEDPCAADLLVRLNATTCDVDPSQLGRDLLARGTNPPPMILPDDRCSLSH